MRNQSSYKNLVIKNNRTKIMANFGWGSFVLVVIICISETMV